MDSTSTLDAGQGLDSIEWNYHTLKALAKVKRVRVESLIALATQNDPFYTGQDAQIKWGKWFAEIWDQFGYTSGVHLRRIHYQLVSQEEAIVLPDGEPYLNTERCWDRLNVASKFSRYLEFVDADDFVDRRAPDPIIYAENDVEEPEIDVEWDPASMALPAFPAALSYDLNGFPAVQRYHLEIWCEKSTMNDVLDPICRRYKCNLITGVGEMTITTVRDLMHRFSTDRPARIFYLSDFDPGGQSMPVAVARKAEYYLRHENGGYDMKLFPIVLTHQQTID